MKLHMNESNAKAVGMYDPRFEHDNCGIGAVVNIKGVKTHQVFCYRYLTDSSPKP